MSQTYYLVKHFFKVYTAYKINFVSILIIPIFAIVYQQNNLIFEQIDKYQYFHYIAIWLSYLSTMTGFTIGHQLVLVREQQFLKQMKFVARGHKIIVYALMLTQLFILIMTVIILSITSTVLFQVPFFELLLYSCGIIFISFLPISFLFLTLNLMPIHAENLQPMITVATAAMLFFTNFIYLNERLSTISIIINPMNYALETGKIWSRLFLPELPINYFGVILASLLYLVLGIYALYRTRITPIYRM